VFANLASISDTSILYGLQELHHHWAALDEIQDDPIVYHLPHKFEDLLVYDHRGAAIV
jgi:hypothetical protein